MEEIFADATEAAKYVKESLRKPRSDTQLQKWRLNFGACCEKQSRSEGVSFARC